MEPEIGPKKCKWCESRENKSADPRFLSWCDCRTKLDEYAMEALRAFLRSEAPANDEDAASAAYDLAEAMVIERAKRRA